MSISNFEHERKYTIDLQKFYNWAQPYITRGSIITRVIRQWYIPEELRQNGVMRIRQTIRGLREVESVELTIKVPTADPAKRNEFDFRASSDFDVNQFVEALDIGQYVVVKDRWDITNILTTPVAIGAVRPEVIVDFFGESDGSTTAILEIENPPIDWEPPLFVVADVTDNITYTNYARATKVVPK